MFNTLKVISKGYQTPEQLRKNSNSQYGVDYEESLGMAYENIQQLARYTAMRVRKIDLNIVKK